MLTRLSTEPRLRRAWPGPEGAEGDLVVELVDGHARGGRWPLGAPAPELPEHDEALPGLAAWRARPGARVVGHRAGRRAVVLTPAGTFVKLATPRATRRGLARLDAVRAALAGSGATGRVGLPVVLDADERAGTVVLAAAAGTSLTEVLAGTAAGHGRGPATGHGTGPATAGPAAAGWAGDGVGGALAALAALPGEGSTSPGQLPPHSLADEAATTRRWVGWARAAGAVDGRAAEDLADRCEQVVAALSGLPEVPGVLAHRDLHDGQVLLDGGGGGGPAVTVLDWDTAAVAHPALDAANLLAHVDRLVALGRVRAGAAARFEERLAAAWGPSAAALAALPALRAATGVRLAAVHAFRP